MKITRSQLKQIIKEELDAAMKEGGVAANVSSEREEDYLPMISSNRPVSSFNRKELKMALAEIPKLKNPAYADALGQHGNQWIEDVYIRAAEMGLYTPPTGADLRRQKGLPDPMKEGRFGDIAAKINAGIEMIIDLPIGMAVGGLIVYLKYKHPRSDFDMMELSKNEAAMTAFINKLKSKEYDGRQFAKDWTNQDMTRDELMSKYFS